MNKPSIEFRNVSKTFYGIKALDSINLPVLEGRVLGLIGQNGAGKSTLMNILGGVVQPDPGGHMTLGDRPYAPRNPAAATSHGIAFIHQELNLFTNLNIAENIFIDKLPMRRIVGVPIVDYANIYRQTADLLNSIGLKLSPKTLIDDLSPGERQMVELVKAVQLDAEVIIFDEPTTSLTARETEQLFSIIEQFRAKGKTMIYISHILADVLTIADDIAVLRDGKLMATGPKSDFTINRMISMMIGRELNQLFPERTSQPQKAVMLDVQNLSQRGIVHDICFQLHQGEVLGIFGLMGSGRTEMARILFGLDSFESGHISIQERALDRSTPKRCIRNGMAFVTENRREEGLLMEATIMDNIVLSSLNQWARTPARLLDKNVLFERATHAAESLQIKSGDISIQKAKSLSGGNQQKAVIAKWLMSRPRIFILDEPTRGVDVGAKFEIYSITNELATNGSGVIFISSELDELIGMCDRILVLGRGEICGEFHAPHYDKVEILRAAFREGGQDA